MFLLHPNQDEESNASQFTALSLSTGVPGAQQSHILSHAATKMQPTSFAIAYARSCEHPCDSQESLTKIKRQRSLDGSALTIGTGSSSSQLKMNGVGHPMESMRCRGFGAGSGGHASEYSGNKPRQIANMFGVGNASEVRTANSSRNSNKVRAYGRANPGSGSVVNDVNIGCPYHQSENGFLSENGKKLSAYRRAGAAFGNTSVSEKIHQRILKNRESAARSRARKQASLSQIIFQQFDKNN